MNQNVQNVDEVEIDLKEVAMVLFSKIWMVLLVGVLAAVMGFVYTKFFVTPMYHSTSTAYVINTQGGDYVSSSDITSATNLVKDFAVLAVEQGILERVIETLELPMTVGQLKANVSVSNPTGTRILQFTVSNHDPELAKRIVDELVRISSEHLTTVMKLKEVNVADPGNVAKAPYNVNTTRNVILGFLLGVFLACAVVLVIYFMDDSFKSSEDVEKYLGLSTLGVLPELNAANGNSGRYYGHR